MTARRTRPHPLRRCLSCRARAPRPELLRIVRRPTGAFALELQLDPKQDGRGAYVHRRRDCLRFASASQKPLARALRRPPPDDILSDLSALANAAPAASPETS